MAQFKGRAVALVRDKNGKPKLSERLRSNPQLIPPAMWAMLTEDEQREVLNHGRDTRNSNA